MGELFSSSLLDVGYCSGLDGNNDDNNEASSTFRISPFLCLLFSFFNYLFANDIEYFFRYYLSQIRQDTALKRSVTFYLAGFEFKCFFRI